MNLPRTLTHDEAHAKVALRVDAFRAMPARRRPGEPLALGVYRSKRREAYKAAVWAVAWHLRHHGWKRIVGPPLTLDELEARHAQYHAAEEATP